MGYRYLRTAAALSPLVFFAASSQPARSALPPGELEPQAVYVLSHKVSAVAFHATRDACTSDNVGIRVGIDLKLQFQEPVSSHFADSLEGRFHDIAEVTVQDYVSARTSAAFATTELTRQAGQGYISHIAAEIVPLLPLGVFNDYIELAFKPTDKPCVTPRKPRPL